MTPELQSTMIYSAKYSAKLMQYPRLSFQRESGFKATPLSDLPPIAYSSQLVQPKVETELHL